MKTNFRNILFFILSVFCFSSNAQIVAYFSVKTLGDSCGSRALELDAALSIGTISTYLWEFRNLTTNTSLGTSPAVKPNQNLIAPGSYEIKLTVGNGATTSSTTKIVKVYSKPVVDFEVDKIEGCMPLTVNFTDKSNAAEGTITKWVWSYGDSKSATFNVPTNASNIYTSGGNFSPTLIVTNSFGCVNNKTINNLVKTYPREIPKFSLTNNTSCTQPHTVNFENISTSPAGTFNYTWDFGDGTRLNSNAKNLTHEYAKEGIFNVKLVGKNTPGTCADSITGIGNQIVVIGKPKASFALLKDSICKNESVPFRTDTDPSGLSNQYKWLFPNNQVRFSNPTSFTFSQTGTFTINLITQNSVSACVSDTFKKEITVLEIPKADFTVSDNTLCSVPREVTFKNNSLDATKYKWTFGDGQTLENTDLSDVKNTYNTFSNFTVVLEASNPVGCSDRKTFSSITNRKPTIDFDFNPNEGCPPLNVTMKITANSVNDPIDKYVFDFGNGRIDTINSKDHSGLLQNTGDYDLQVHVITQEKCTSSSTKKKVAVSEVCNDDGGGGGGSGGGGGFGVDRGNGGDRCSNKYVFTFKNTILKSSVVKWTFDGTDGGKNDPAIHDFSNTIGKKEFLVVLEVYDSISMSNKIFKKNVIAVDEKANFKTDKIDYCRNDNALFTTIKIDSSNIHKFIWDYNDSSKIDTLDNKKFFELNLRYLNGKTNHKYIKNGTFDPKLTIEDKFGCIDSLRFKSINVGGPVAKYDTMITPYCKGLFGVKFIDLAESYNNKTIEKWNWNFDNGNTTTILTKDSTFEIIYEDPSRIKTFKPILEVVDVNGCKDTVSKKIVTPASDSSPKANFGIDTTSYCGSKYQVELSDSSVQNGSVKITSWSWDFGNGIVENRDTNDVFSKDLTINTFYQNRKITLTIKDSIGCQDKKEIFYDAFNPRADFQNYETRLVCGKKSFNFYNTSQAQFAKYTWDFGEGVLVNQNNNFFNHVFADTGSFTVKLFVEDAGGCKDTLEQKNYIQIVKPKADFAIGDTTQCVGEFTSVFTSTSKVYTPSPTYLWDFGDGNIGQDPKSSVGSNFYETAGKYKVKLKIIDLNGCSDSISKNVRVKGPKGEMFITDSTLCIGEKLNAQLIGENIAFSSWNFGDNSATSQWNLKKDVEHVYLNPGKFLPNIILQSEGCQIIVSAKDSVFVDKINAGPDANIECGDEYTQLKGKSALNIPGNYVWTPEDPTTTFDVDDISLETKVNRTGFFVLTTKNNWCSVSDTAIVTTSGIVPNVNAGVDKKIDCISKKVNLTGFTSTLDTKYEWRSLSNGILTDAKLPTITVDKSGEYILKITQKFCEKEDTVQVFACSLNAKDSIIKICSNTPVLPAQYDSYDINLLNTFVIGGVNSNVVWYQDSLFQNPIPSPFLLIDSIKFYAKIISLDGTEIGRSKILPVVHDYVSVDFDDIKNSCEKSESFQLTGMSPINGTFFGNHITDQGLFTPPQDSGTYEIGFTYKSIEGCTDTLQKNAKVINVPAKPIVSDIRYCQDLNPVPQLETLPLAESTLIWYSDSTKTPLSAKPILDTKMDTLTYFVSQKNSLCESFKSEIEIIVDSTPLEPKVMILDTICEGFSRTLTTNGLPNSTFDWILDGGALLTYNPSTTTQQFFTAGNEKIEVKIKEKTQAGCIGKEATYFIPLDSLPTKALVNNLETDTNYFCVTDITKSIDANTPLIGKGKWNIIKNYSSTLSSFNSNSTEILNFESIKDTMVVEWEIKNGICPSSKALLYNFPIQAFTPKIVLEEIPTICTDTLITIKSKNEEYLGDNPTFEFYNANHEKISSNILSDSLDIFVNRDSLIYIAVTSNYPCLTRKIDSSEVIKIDVTPYTVASILSKNDTICETELPLVLKAQDNFQQQVNYRWFYKGNDLSDKKEISIKTIPESGEYILKTFNPFCSPSYDTMRVKIYEKPNLKLKELHYAMFGKDETVKLDLKVNYKYANQDSTSLLWSPVSFLAKNNEFEPIDNKTITPFYITQDHEIVTDYEAIVFNGREEDQCFEVIGTRVINFIPINIPNAFSPNNDNLNDTWVIRGLARYPNTKVKVFNRWGNILHSDENGYGTPWDGISNSEKVPVGTYYYTIDFLGSVDGSDYSANGWLVIVE